MDIRKSQPDRTATTFQPYPAVDKDNFRVYHQTEDDVTGPAAWSQRSRTTHSIYPTTPDNPFVRKIVNSPKPEVTLRYIHVRGEAIKSRDAKRVSGSSTNHAKKKKVTPSTKESTQRVS